MLIYYISSGTLGAKQLVVEIIAKILSFPIYLILALIAYVSLERESPIYFS
jgi:hypothetical protein